MKNLKEKLESFEIGSSSDSLTFTRGLARENDWSLEFSTCVVNEYKRFIYLAATSDHQMTPSDQVDQAWHLHMTYTRSYWIDLCKNTLGFELHHMPTKGGDDEGKKFRKQYQNTLKRYQYVFSSTPPDDI